MLGNIVKKLFATHPQKKNIRVLVIEDNPVDQRVACSAINRGGYSAFTAADGKTGLSMAEELNPDLIILDYQLPDTTGPEVCKALKAQETTSRIPVLFLTSMTTPSSIINCYEQGGENYLAKPINVNFLLKQIDQALKDGKSQAC